MVVRIQLSSGARVRQKRRKNQHVTGQFPIADGLFSHWQVWLTVAATLQFSAILLNRYGKTEAALPETVESADRKLASSRY